MQPKGREFEPRTLHYSGPGALPGPLLISATGRRIGMSVRARVVAILALPLLLSLAATEAAAHVRLVSSAPANGAVESQMPATIRLVFSERIQLGLTTVVLLGPAGDTAAIGPLRFGDAELEVRADVIGPGAAGTFVVVWRTVSADGHPVSGRLPFIVTAVEADTFAIAEPTEAGPPAADPVPSPQMPAQAEAEPTGFHVRSPVFVAIRWLSYLALAGMFGATAFLAVLLPAVARRAPDWRGPDLEAAWRARRWGVLAAVGFLLAAVARLVAQGTALAGPLAVDMDVLNAIVLESAWGYAWIVQVAAGFVMAGMLAGAERRWAQLGALGMVPVIAIAMGAAGHALTTPWPAALVAAHAGHLIAVGVWLGGLSMLLLAALPAAQSMGAGVAPRMATMVNRFSPIALTCGGIVMATGTLAAAVHLGGLSPLWESDYGQILALKLLVFAAVVGFGAWNWRRMRPSLAASPEAAPLRASGGTELAFAAIVLLVTSLLVATPPPG